MVKLKQVFPGKLVFEVEEEKVEIPMEQVEEQVKLYVQIVGEQPDEENMKKIIRKLVKDVYEKKRIIVSKPDFSKFINMELEAGEE